MKILERLNKYGISFFSIGFISNILIHLFYSFVRIEFASYGFNDFLKHSELTIQYSTSIILCLIGIFLLILDVLDLKIR